MSTTRKNDMSRIVGGLAKLEGPANGYTGTDKPNPQRMAAQSLIRRSKEFSTVAAAANGTTNTTATGSSAMFRAPCACRILQVHFIATGAVVADATNNAQLSIKKADGTVVATVATALTGAGGTGTLAAGVPVSVPLSVTLANQRLAQGDVIGPAISMNASGVAVPAGVFQVEYELEGPLNEVGV